MRCRERFECARTDLASEDERDRAICTRPPQSLLSARRLESNVCHVDFCIALSFADDLHDRSRTVEP